MAEAYGAATAGSAGVFRIGDAFGRTFDVFGRKVPQYFILTLIAQIPMILLALAITQFRSDPTVLMVLGVGAVILSIICTTVAQAVIIYGVFQDMRGKTSSIGESLEIGLRRFLPMVGVALCTGLLISVGAVLLVVPGLMLACRYYVAMPACITENEGVFASMARSAGLTKGYRWQIFGVFLLVTVATVLGGMVIGFVAANFGPIVLQIASTVWQVLAGAFGAVVAAIVYYNLRVVKEGVDIDRIAQVFD